jgi:serine/threonine protein kinase
MVLEFCPFDLEKVIQSKSIVLRTHHVKCYMKMILSGIECLHKNFVLHRGLFSSVLLKSHLRHTFNFQTSNQQIFYSAMTVR